MVAIPTSSPTQDPSRSILLMIVVAALAVMSLALGELPSLQPLGFDFSCFWAGAHVALDAPSRLYDFQYVTALQHLPPGDPTIRPFAYPPSALFLFIPFGLLPFWLAYSAWCLLSAGVFVGMGLKAGSRWWLLLFMPVGFALYCGQVTLLIGGLVLGGLTYSKSRPIMAGILLGLAAAVKPQFLLLAPLGLLADGRWKTLIVAGFTGLALVSASVMIWGFDIWTAWVAALPRFHDVIFNDPNIVKHGATPAMMLKTLGLRGVWAYPLIPIVIAGVWLVFRRSDDLLDRSLVIFGGTLLIAPYAMSYEAALLAPAAAAYLHRTKDRRWLATVGACCLYGSGLPTFFLSIFPILALPFLRSRSPEPSGSSA